jgi:hypothetical protein
MPGTVRFKIEGVAELERAMREFGPRFTNNVSGRALRAMAKPIVQRGSRANACGHRPAQEVDHHEAASGQGRAEDDQPRGQAADQPTVSPHGIRHGICFCSAVYAAST